MLTPSAHSRKPVLEAHTGSAALRFYRLDGVVTLCDGGSCWPPAGGGGGGRSGEAKVSRGQGVEGTPLPTPRSAQPARAQTPRDSETRTEPMSPFSEIPFGASPESWSPGRPWPGKLLSALLSKSPLALGTQKCDSRPCSQGGVTHQGGMSHIPPDSSAIPDQAPCQGIPSPLSPPCPPSKPHLLLVSCRGGPGGGGGASETPLWLPYFSDGRRYVEMASLNSRALAAGVGASREMASGFSQSGSHDSGEGHSLAPG